MAPLTTWHSHVRRRIGRPHLAVLGAAALVGACASISVADESATPAVPEDTVAAVASPPPPETEENARPVSVDARLVRAVAEQILAEQGRPPDLTDLDLIARDVLAQGPLTVEDVPHLTSRTLQGHGPGGPADTHVLAPSACPPTARACIDVDGKRAWIQSEGRITYGPVPVTTGQPGYETTRGAHRVLRHVRDDHSRIFDTPMPFSTYFTINGIAFHEGRLDEPSHGCIHLGHHAAVHFFEQLRVGDQVVAF